MSVFDAKNCDTEYYSEGILANVIRISVSNIANAIEWDGHDVMITILKKYVWF